MAKAEGVPLNEWAKANDDVFDKLCKKYKVADKDLKDFLKTWDGSGDIQEAFTAHMKQSANSMTLFQRAGKAAGTVIKSLGATLASVAVSFAIAEVISLVAKGIDNLAHKAEYAKDRLDEFNASVKDQQSNLSTQENWIKEYGEKYEKLAEGVDKYGHNVSLTSDEFSEYKNLTSQIAEMFPTMITGWNEQGDAILKNKGSIEELTKAYQENQDAYYADIRSNSTETFNGYKTESKDDVKKKNTIEELMGKDLSYTSIKNILGQEEGKLIDISDTDISSADIQNALGVDLYNQIYEELKQMPVGKFGTTFKDLSPEIQQKIKDIYSKLNDTIDTESEKVRPILQAYLQGDTSGYDELDEEAKTAVQSFIQNVDSSFFENFKTDGDMNTWIKQNIIEPLKNGVNSDDLAVKIQTLFSLDQKDYKSYQDYVNAVLAIINSLSKMKDKDGNVIYNDKQINTMKTQFGVGDVDSDGNVSGNKYVSSVQDRFKNVKGAKDYIAGLNKEELDTVMQYKLEPDKDTSVKDLKDFIKNELQPEAKKTFSSTFDSDDFKKSKESLLELAKAGELTPYTISSTKEYNALLEDTGLSAEKAYKKIMKIAQSDMKADWKTTLTNARSQIAEIKNAKNELKNNGESSDFMNTILEKFPQLIGYLGDQKGMQEQLNELQKEQEDVANNAYMHMVEDSEAYYSTLKQKEADKLKTTSGTISKIVNGNAGLVKILGGYYKADLSNYGSIAKAKAGLEKDLITGLAGAWSKFYKVQVNAQTGLAEVLNDTTTVPSEYLGKTNGDYGKAVSMMVKEQNKQKKSALEAAKAYNEAIKGFDSIVKNPGVSTNIGSGSKGSNSNKAKSAYQAFSQTIDWCAQTLKKLSAQIDNVQAKLNNTSALSKQISYYKKLVNAQNELTKSYEKTESKYNKIYKNALKKLSKSDQKKVRDGSYTIEHFKGKAKSGKKSGAEKRYNNIQKALTARDNYLEASTNSENEKQKLAEYREALASVRWENVTTKVEKLNNQISILDTRMSNVSGYVAKNKVLNEQLDLQKKVIDKQQEAYKENQKDADAYYKKISSKNKKNKNSDGTIKTTGVKDQKQLSYIKTYNAYLKQQATNLIELKQAQEDYYNTIINAKQTAAENIKTDYDNRISLIDAKRQELENKASLAEAKGQVVSGSYYKLIANNSNQRLEKLNAEKDKLESQMKGVRKYSDLWYTLQANVISVDQAIADETKNAVENINKQAEAIKNLADAKNDYLNSRSDTLDWLNSFTNEDDYYDNDGNYTDKAYAVMHNKLAQIELNKTKSKNHEQALNDLDELYYSKDSKLSEAEWLKQRDEIIKSYQQSQTNAYNLEKELADMRNKQLEQQSEKLKDIIDLKKKSLDADKSEYDYQKSISEKTKNIADLQKQLAMLEGNNSEDAMAQRQKLQKELSDANDDLKDTQYDKYLDRLEDVFSDLEDRFDELIEEMKKEDVSTSTENIRTDVEDNNSSRAENGNKEILNENGLQVFDKTASDLITAGTNIETKVDDVNTKLDKIVEAVIKDDKEGVGNGNGTVKTTTDLDKVLGKYDAKNKSQDTKGKSSITKYLASQGYKTKNYEGMLDLVNGILNSDYTNGMNGDDRTALSKITTKDQLDGNKDKNATANKDLITKSLKYVKANEFISNNAIVGKKKRDEYSKANRHIYDKTGGKILSEKNLKKLADILNVSYDGTKIYDALKSCGYSHGGIVGKAIRTNGDDGIATLKVGEAVLTPVQTEALVELSKNLVPLNNFMGAIRTNIPNVQRSATTSIGDVSFEFNLPNVVDSESLIKTIQTDTRLQKTLQNATVGQLNGSSKFKVNRL